MRFRFAGLLLAGVTACGIRNPVRNTMTIQPDEDRQRVTVSVRTDIANNGNDRRENDRLSEARTAISDRRDPWTLRFAALNADSERVVYEKSRGILRSAEWSAKINMSELQQFLSDFGTLQITDGDHGTELAFYPSSSTRATRQQREHVEKAMLLFATDTVRYFRNLDRLYSYLDRAPDRARPVFAILFSDWDKTKSTIEEEEALLKAVEESMSLIFDHVDQARQQGITLDEEFDLVFNPLPAEIVVRLPSALVSSEGFDRRDERTMVIPRSGLVDAIFTLEGRWVSPDPLAILARASDTNSDNPRNEDVAARPRHSTPTVTADEIEKALAARVRPAAAYRVRW